LRSGIEIQNAYAHLKDVAVRNGALVPDVDELDTVKTKA
jgi:hypothetical protein